MNKFLRYTPTNNNTIMVNIAQVQAFELSIKPAEDVDVDDIRLIDQVIREEDREKLQKKLDNKEDPPIIITFQVVIDNKLRDLVTIPTFDLPNSLIDRISAAFAGFLRNDASGVFDINKVFRTARLTEQETIDVATEKDARTILNTLTKW